MPKTPHAIQRAHERYGLTLTMEDLAALALKIKSGDGMRIGKQNDGVEDWAVYHETTLVRCIVNPGKTHILTFLPMNAKLTPSRYSGKLSRRIKRIVRTGKGRKAA